jgi:mannose-6-phosphate isomerase-like protein (cupin superfamily)
MTRHKQVIVRKPWGYEYLAYQNADVALWVLHIRQGECTSMHCHPTKSTGLVVLEGQAEINFIADSKILNAPSKQMIRRGLFHQTHALSEDGIIMFEVETPVDKDDLVRLHDAYGRKDAGYEGTDFELPKTEECLWLENPIGTPFEYKFNNRTIVLENAHDGIFEQYDENEIMMFVQGGLIKNINSREHLVTVPGDVGQIKVVKQVAKEMDGFAKNSIVMVIK